MGVNRDRNREQNRDITDNHAAPYSLQEENKRALYPRLAATNQSGFCPVRLTARWHGEELQVDTGEIILPQRVRSDGEVEKLWQSDAQMVLGGRKLTVKEEGIMPTHPDSSANINARLTDVVKQVIDTFNRLYDAAPFEKVSKAAMLAELLPTEVRPAAAAAPVKMEATRTFRQVLEEWKAENRNLAKDSLRKYDQLATMMEVWRAVLGEWYDGEPVR